MSDISSLADMHVSFDIVLKLISFANNLKLKSVRIVTVEHILPSSHS